MIKAFREQRAESAPGCGGIRTVFVSSFRDVGRHVPRYLYTITGNALRGMGIAVRVYAVFTVL